VPAPPAAPPPARIGRASGAWIQLGAALLVAIALLAVVESSARLALRLLAQSSSGAASGEAADFVEATIAGSELAPERNPAPLVSDRYLLWRNQPLAQRTQPINPRPYGRDESWSLAIDSRGHRGPEQILASPHPERFRILCVGDSVTYGFNVDQGAEWPRRLEALLNAADPEHPVEVVNAGVPGWSWVQGLRYVQHEGLALAPDLVIAAHGTNDRFWSASATDFERLPRARAAAPELRAPRWLARSGSWRLASLIAQGLFRPHAGRAPASDACAREIRETGRCLRLPLADIERAIGELAGELRAAGIPLLLLNLDFFETDAVEALRAAAEREALPFVDFVARFRAQKLARESALARELGLAPAALTTETAPGETRRVLFRVSAPAGVTGALGVRGNPYLRSDGSFRAPLRDDGSGGDERAGDGVHSGFADTAAAATVLEYQYWLGETPELEPLPPLPSATGTRLLLVGGHTRAPIASFGDLGWMAERTHPNAQGHAVIAERLAELVPRLRATSRFAATRRAP
jgi:lysophospholipase L1-like esterase